MSYNITARHLTITVTVGSGKNAEEVDLVELPNDADPIAIEPLSHAEPVMDLNGNLIVKRKHVPYKVTISVIPRTESEIALSRYFGLDVQNGERIPVEITVSRRPMSYDRTNENWDGDVDELGTYTEGRFIGASVGYGVSGGGAFETKNFTFIFKSMTH